MSRSRSRSYAASPISGHTKGRFESFAFLPIAKKTNAPDEREFPIYTQRIPTEAIKAVIMGERMPVKVQREVFGRFYDSNVAVSLAAVSHSGFEFRREVVKYGVSISQMSPVISPEDRPHLCRSR